MIEKVKEILVKQCQTHEHRGCNCTPQDADDCWGAIALQICQLSQERVERILKEIEKTYPGFVSVRIRDWWQALKKKELEDAI